MQQFRIHPTLKIKDHNGEYTGKDLSKAVHYWERFIEDLPDNKFVVTVFPANTSFSTLAALIALLSTGTSYLKIEDYTELTDAIADGLIQEEDAKISLHMGSSAEAHNIPPDSIYVGDFLTDSLASEEQTTVVKLGHTTSSRMSFSSGTTGKPKLISVSQGNDASAIAVAISKYFKHDDYCVFAHGLSHIGTHTTAILPSVFNSKNRTVALCGSGEQWNEEILNATHIQYFSTMIREFPLPADNHIRIATTGGNKISAWFTEYMLSHGVEQILDIYGSTEIPPPVGINPISSVADIDDPFLVVSNQYDFYTSTTNSVVWVYDSMLRKMTFELSDQIDISVNDNKRYLKFMGRLSDAQDVRLNGVRISIDSFKMKFESHTGIRAYYLAVEELEIILYVKHADVEIAENFLISNNAEVTLLPVDDIPTSSGIKYTRPKI